MRLLLPLLLLSQAAVLPTLGAEPNSGAHLLPLDEHFPAEDIATPGVQVHPFGQRKYGEARFEQQAETYESELAYAHKKAGHAPRESWSQEIARAEKTFAKFRAEKEDFITRNNKQEFGARPLEDYE